MAYPHARTFDEAYFYMELRPCVCGQTQFEKESTHSLVDGVPVTRYTGQCEGCGRQRRFTFEMPAETPTVSFEMRYGLGDESSTLIDAGEWLGAAEVFTANVSAMLGAGDLADDDLSSVYYLLSSAIAATEEVLKFLPAGMDEVPETAFWTQGGRLALEIAPERFRRAALEQDLAERRRAMADFEQKYGED
jgi:hypothetical protein